MDVLVTGGAGFIGSWLVERLLRDGHTVVVLDNFNAQIHGLDPDLTVPWLDSTRGVELVRADVRDHDAVDRALARVQAVVHLAAETGTGQSMYQIDHYYTVNVQATAFLIEAVATRHRHVRQLVLASSRSIYGEGAYRLDGQLYVPPSRSGEQMKAGDWEPKGPHGEPLALMATPEHAPPSAASVYAATKLANEQLAQVVAHAYGLSIAALRFQNVYGERQSLRNPYTGILSIFSNRMRQHLPINIFEDGHESRDFVHVSDVVDSIVTMLRQTSGGYAVYNVGSGRSTSVLEIASALKQALGSRSALQVTGDFRVGDIRHCHADISALARDVGFAPKMSLDQGIGDFCRWVQGQAIVEDRSSSAMQELTQHGLSRTR